MTPELATAYADRSGRVRRVLVYYANGHGEAVYAPERLPQPLERALARAGFSGPLRWPR